MNNYYKPGVWNIYCQVCERKLKSDQIHKRWDGVWVCKNDFETKHPQTFIKTVRETSNELPFVNKSAGELDVSPTYTIPLEPVPPGTFNNGT